MRKPRYLYSPWFSCSWYHNILSKFKLFFSFSLAVNKTGEHYTVICMFSMRRCYRYLYVQHDVLFQVSVCAAWCVVPCICMCSITCYYRHLYVEHDVLLQLSACEAWRVVIGTCMCSMTCCYRYLYVQHDVLLQVSVVQHDVLLQVSLCAAQST
jgi:hypothetical protein